MDVVPDEDLHDFIDSIDNSGAVKEELAIDTDNPHPQPSSSSDAAYDYDGNIWDDITASLDNWIERILDAEARHSKTVNFYQRVEESLTRQQQDGLLSVNELAELRYIANLWWHLLHTSSYYTAGCNFLKKDIIELLLDLYSVRQITRGVFLDSCLKL
jgi:hypothetical protein